ncbi:MAG TPA: FAD-dependent oxidoreductase [Mycobacteriales bacterium]|jgi:2-polyprenyl-6-methoxyphenol hydroxylase-like FAD-dependent oxidoreductase|nr:FAD-dependent oxidoreductase [Mycobacteriales bacterium]
MARIVMCGGGIVGLAAAVLLARDGHDVTVLETDPSEPPGDPAAAWDGWQRRGVAQFRQAHVLLPRVRQVLQQELPEAIERLLAAGCVWEDVLHPLPPTLSDQDDRPGDDRFRTVTGRRPVLEAVFAGLAADEPGVTVRRGTCVAGLLAAAGPVPAVQGVRLEDGSELRADLVVDAMGRRMVSTAWLSGLGVRPQVEAEDCGFVYYTRFYTGERPQRFGPPLVPYGTFSLLTLPGDNGTWSITAFAATGDRELKALREPDAFTRVVQACPMQAHWLAGEPVTGVLAMAGILDRHRRLALEGRPLVVGLVAVGDAWACTNPSAGRGISVGLLHAQLLRQVVREVGLSDLAALAEAWDAATTQRVEPYYRGQVAADRARLAEMNALRSNTEMPAPGPTDIFATAAMHDPELFRAFVEVRTAMALRHEVLARPGIAERLDAPGDRAPMVLPGPDRSQLLAALAG